MIHTTCLDAGFETVEDVASLDDLGRAQRTVDDALEWGAKDPTVRVADGAPMVSLLNAGEAIDRLWTHPRVLDAVERLLGTTDFRLQQVRCRNPKPGHGEQELHSEGPPSPRGETFLVNVIFPLVDFTVENGATRVVPGSHLLEPASVRHLRDELSSRAVQVPVRAGDALAFSGHLLHSGTTNRSNAARPSVQASYLRRGLEERFGDGSDRASNATVDRLGDHLHLLL